jgi:hypothetical protein
MADMLLQLVVGSGIVSLMFRDTILLVCCEPGLFVPFRVNSCIVLSVTNNPIHKITRTARTKSPSATLGDVLVEF